MDVNELRKKQLRFALLFGIPYFVFILFIYLLTYLASDWVAGVTVLSLPLHYFLVAILVYPITWVLFIYYVKQANSMEDEIKKL